MPSSLNELRKLSRDSTTLDYDRKVKVPLYAQAGIPETWVVNLPEERVEFCADPASGAYQAVNSYGRGDELQSRALVAVRASAAEVLG